MVIISFELKNVSGTTKFYNEAKIILENNGFVEINKNTFVSNEGMEKKAKLVADKLAQSGAFKALCKTIYFGVVRTKE